jgi:hypothetical protein
MHPPGITTFVDPQCESGSTSSRRVLRLAPRERWTCFGMAEPNTDPHIAVMHWVGHLPLDTLNPKLHHLDQ